MVDAVWGPPRDVEGVALLAETLCKGDIGVMRREREEDPGSADPLKAGSRDVQP